MTAFAADLEALAQIVEQLAAFERAAAECIDDVDARAARTVSVWTGAAADEYAAVHVGWRRDARELHAALGTLRQVVATAHGNYSDAVAANRAMWP